MKKIVCIIACLLLTGCSSPSLEEESISILAPSGAPSLAFVNVYEDVCENGTMDIVDGSDLLMAVLYKRIVNMISL